MASGRMDAPVYEHNLYFEVYNFYSEIYNLYFAVCNVHFKVDNIVEFLVSCGVFTLNIASLALKYV